MTRSQGTVGKAAQSICCSLVESCDGDGDGVVLNGGKLAEAIRCGGMVGKEIMGDNDGEAVKTSERAGESSPPDELCGIFLILSANQLCRCGWLVLVSVRKLGVRM